MKSLPTQTELLGSSRTHEAPEDKAVAKAPQLIREVRNETDTPHPAALLSYDRSSDILCGTDIPLATNTDSAAACIQAAAAEAYSTFKRHGDLSAGRS